jgi:hypothetical protein
MIIDNSNFDEESKEQEESNRNSSNMIGDIENARTAVVKHEALVIE